MSWKRSAACASIAFVASLLVAGCGGAPKSTTTANPATAASMSEMGRRTGMGQPKSMTGMPGGGAGAGMRPPGMSPAGMPPGGMPGMPR